MKVGLEARDSLVKEVPKFAESLNSCFPRNVHNQIIGIVCYMVKETPHSSLNKGVEVGD